MAKMTIDDLLSQPEEKSKHDLTDAARIDTGPDIKSAIERADPKAKKQLRKMAEILRRAVKLAHSGQGLQAAKLAMRALDMDPESSLANHVMGVAMEEMGRLSVALNFYQRSFEKDPSCPDIYQSLAMVAWKLDMLPAAEKFLRLFLQMLPGNIDGTINLAGILRDQGKFDDAIEILRASIYLNPNHHDLWNSLGTVLIESGDPHQAVTFYRESLRLEPDFGRAYNNIAYALELTGEVEEAIEAFDNAIERAASEKDLITMRHGRSLTLLAAGHLERGWKEYETRLHPHYKSATLFQIDAPRWSGADPAELRGKTVVMVGEQGVGDEVSFSNIIPDVLDAIGPEGELRIACERRLIPLFERAFPGVVVGAHASARLEGRDFRIAESVIEGRDRVDLWFPFGQPFRAFRSTPDAFPQKLPLKVNEAHLKAFSEQLSKVDGNMKVGLIWKSLKMTANRQKYFGAFEGLKALLKVPGVTFVNMQYGDAQDDIDYAKKEFGIEIYQPEDIDLKQDLDKVAALGKACDLVVGPMNTSSALTSAVGGNIWVMHSSPHPWTLFGTDQLLWYPGSKSYCAQHFGDFKPVVEAMAVDLTSLVKAQKAA